MNFLFFGGWLCAALALLVGAVLLTMLWLELHGFKFKPSTRDAASFGLGVWMIASVAATLCLFIVGSIALYKGWLW